MKSEHAGHIPTLNWVKRRLKQNIVAFYGEVLNAYVVGSIARGTARPDSDLDIAVIIKKQRSLSALKFTERYHSRILSENWKPQFNGRVVDFQFFYESDQELNEYEKIKIDGF
ncbi:MAG TPA: nucleotidyltransferase domain-containing protein [Pyrinomonadaceae bacterium]|nr:nucleotidyltransferase domain-containing protein [Pyrinomonadaceae bacterium]